MSHGARVLEERRDQHYLRRHGNLAVRRSRMRRGLFRRLLSIAAQIAVIVVLYLVGKQVYLAVITSPRFDVKTVAIRGNHHAKTADLLAQCGTVVSRNIFQVNLERLGEVTVFSNRAIVAIVGVGLRGTRGLAARLFHALRDVNIEMISQGASAINVTLVVEEADGPMAVRLLHHEFFEREAV